MINENDYNKIAESMTEIIDRIVAPQDIEKLTAPQRRYLLALRWKWMQGEEVIGTIKDVLGIKKTGWDTPKEFYLQTKLK